MTPGSDFSFEEVLRRLDRVLSAGKFEDDIRLAGLVSCKLCERLSSQLDAEQLAALNVAKLFWAGSETEDVRLSFVVSLQDDWTNTRTVKPRIRVVR